eukprot:825832_1
MFRIYQPAVTRSPTCYASHSMLQSTRLMNEFLQRYERDPISLSKKGTSFNTRLVVTFYTFCGIVVAFKHWNVTQKREATEFYYDEASRLGIKIFCPRQRFLPKIDPTLRHTSHTEFADA